MSAPNTDPEKQRTRHWPALWGIKGAMVFGALVMIAVIFYAVVRSTDPREDASPELEPATQQEAVPSSN